MPTKTTCRVGSDVDLLSRIQLEEVLFLLDKHGANKAVSFITPEESPSLKESRTQPNSPSRLALLLNGLLQGECDALVLDASRLSCRLPSGITIGALTRRYTPYEALISSEEVILDELAEHSVVVANEQRREAQMLYYRPDLKIARSRGSLDSLIQKVKNGKIDAAVIAAADMERLQKQDFVVELLTTAVCIPAAGQGALAVLVRSSEKQFRECIQEINNPTTYRELRAEWAFLDYLGLDGRAPAGVLAATSGKVLEIEGVLAYPDGREKIHFVVKGSPGQDEDLGQTLAAEILEAGGREILQELHLM